MRWIVGKGIGVPFRMGGSGLGSSYWTTHFISALTVVTTSDTAQTVTATIAGGAGPDGVSFEYSDDGGATWGVAITDADGILNQTGLTADTDYTWRARLYKGTNYGSYVTAESVRTFGVAYAVLDSNTNGEYNTYSCLAQHPTDKNLVILTYLEKAKHAYTYPGVLKMRTSTDKGQTWGAASTIFDPGVGRLVMDAYNGYSGDGRLHILLTEVDETTGANCQLIYLYSDDDGTNFTSADITATVTDATRPVFRNSSALIENGGVLMAGFYRQAADLSSSERMILRLVAGTWAAVSVEITAAYENEIVIERLGGDNLIALVRDGVATYLYIQFKSDDNGLTWTRLERVSFNVANLEAGGYPCVLRKFEMEGEDIIVCYFSRGLPPDRNLYAIYGKTTDLLELGTGGWNYSSLKILIGGTEGGYVYRQGDVLHYDNNYNAVAVYPYHNLVTLTQADLITFEIATTDYATLQGYLFPTYSADAESNAFNAVNNTNPTAIVNLIGGLKQYSIYTKIKAAYPMLGGTAALHKFNLVNPADSDAAFRLTFAGTWTHSATGAKPNGTDANADTHLSPNDVLALYSTHIGVYLRESVLDAGIVVGAGTSIDGTTYPGFGIRCRYTDGIGRYYANNFAVAAQSIIGAVDNNMLGLTLGSRTTNQIAKIYYRGIQSGTTNTSTALNQTTDRNLIVGAADLNGTITAFSVNQIAFITIGDGLTDIEVHNFNRIIHYFQKTLSRNV